MWQKQSENETLLMTLERAENGLVMHCKTSFFCYGLYSHLTVAEARVIAFQRPWMLTNSSSVSAKCQVKIAGLRIVNFAGELCKSLSLCLAQGRRSSPGLFLFLNLRPVWNGSTRHPRDCYCAASDTAALSVAEKPKRMQACKTKRVHLGRIPWRGVSWNCLQYEMSYMTKTREKGVSPFHPPQWVQANWNTTLLCFWALHATTIIRTIDILVAPRSGFLRRPSKYVETFTNTAPFAAFSG